MKLDKAEILHRTADKATYGASSGALYFGFTANDIAMWAAAITAVLSFILGQYWKWKHYQLAKVAAARSQLEACATCDKITEGASD